LLLNLAVTLGSLSLAALAEEEITLGVVIRVVHLNLIVTSLFSIAWMIIANRWSWKGSQEIISTQLLIVTGLLLALLGLADLGVLIERDFNSMFANAMGSMWAWGAAAVTGAAYARYHGRKSERLTLNDFGTAAVVFGSLLACSLSRLDD